MAYTGILNHTSRMRYVGKVYFFLQKILTRMGVEPGTGSLLDGFARCLRPVTCLKVGDPTLDLNIWPFCPKTASSVTSAAGSRVYSWELWEFHNSTKCEISVTFRTGLMGPNMQEWQKGRTDGRTDGQFHSYTERGSYYKRLENVTKPVSVRYLLTCLLSCMFNLFTHLIGLNTQCCCRH